MSGGFDSGFIFVPMGTTAGFPSWNLTVTDDSQRKFISCLSRKDTVTYFFPFIALYFYCAQLQPAPHCSSGMVG